MNSILLNIVIFKRIRMFWLLSGPYINEKDSEDETSNKYYNDNINNIVDENIENIILYNTKN